MQFREWIVLKPNPRAPFAGTGRRERARPEQGCVRAQVRGEHRSRQRRYFPNQVIAGHHADLVVGRINGRRPKDNSFYIYLGGLIGGGWGAKHDSDGRSATIALNDGDTHNGPSEQVEARAKPLRRTGDCYRLPCRYRLNPSITVASILAQHGEER